MNKINPEYKNKEYWSEENQQFSRPHFRLEKFARIIDILSRGKECDLLDVGCGPAALSTLLKKNINYFGIDIAIHEPAPNLIETDIIKDEIQFRDKHFDLIVASGVFEYMGDTQKRKLLEIRNILKEDGYLLLSYVNFNHYNKRIWPNYNNIQSIKSLENDINLFFHIERRFPIYHSRSGLFPRRKNILALQMPMQFNIPIISPHFAVEYMLICSTQ